MWKPRALAAALALLCGCRAEAPPAASTPALRPPPHVEVRGCAERRAETICELPVSGRLTLWVARASAETLDVRIDDRPRPPLHPTSVQGGLRFEIEPSPGRLEVHVTGHRPYRATLQPSRGDARLDEVRALRRGGALDDAQALLDEIVATGTVAGAWGERARNLLAAGRLDEAQEALHESIRRATEDGRLWSMTQDRGVLAYLHLRTGTDFSRAKDAIAPLEALAQRHGWAASVLDYYSTTAAVRARDPRAGLLHSRRALAYYERVGDDGSRLDMRQYRIILLRQMHRWAELRADLDALAREIGERQSPCKRAQAWNNLGWNRLLGHRQSELHFPSYDPTPLERAEALYRGACARPVGHREALMNLAWAALLARADPEGARRYLRHAEDLDLPTKAATQLDLEHLEAEILAVELEQRPSPRRARATLRALTRLERKARQAQALDIQWRALLGLARLHEAQGAMATARHDLVAAQDVLTTWAQRVPLGEGRDTLLYDQGAGARALIRLLTEMADGLSAIREIRRIRLGVAAWAKRRAGTAPSGDDASRRRLRAARASLDATLEQAWTVPDDRRGQLAAELDAHVWEAKRHLESMLGGAQPGLPELHVAPQDVLLFAYPLETDLVVWVLSTRGDTAVRTSTGALDALGPHLAAARRVRVYAHPALLGLPWDEIMVQGTPLYTRATTQFHADLGPTANAGPDRTGLVVADPAGELPRARAEGDAVVEAWRRAGLEVDRLGAPLAVPALRAALERAPSRLHYSGHGVQAGLDGLDGGFPLGGARRFTVVDVLALRRVPRRVVLAACDLGARETAGFSTAQAFLLEGSAEVIAATRPVGDRDAARWSGTFYRMTAETDDWAEALRRTRAHLAEHAPSVDAEAFRLWVRD